MDDSLGLIKVVFLALLIAAVGFVGAMVHRAQEELITIRQSSKTQGDQMRDMAVAQDRLLEDLSRIKTQLARGVAVAHPNGASTRHVVPGQPDGIMRSDGKNCLIDRDTIPDPSPGAVAGGTLNMLTKTDFNDMNTLLDNSAGLMNIDNLVSMPLYGREFMQDGRRFYSGVAKSLMVTDDYKTYTLTLHDNIYWHTPAVNLDDPKYTWVRELGPQKITAHDYVFTVMDLILNPDTKCDVARVQLSKLDRVEALDDFTLRVTWKEKFFPSRTASAFSNVLPRFLYGRFEDGSEIPQAALGEEFNTHWYNDKMIGCGPYRFVEYVEGQRIVLERNKAYPFRAGGHFDKIVYHIVKEPAQQIQRFKNGDIDFMELEASQYEAEIKRLENDPAAQKKSPFFNGQLKWRKLETPGYSYIGWNQNREIFQDKRVRKALTLALPVRKLLEDVWMGFGEELSGPIHKFSPDYDKNLPYIPFDLSAASALLDEAGWRDNNGDGIREKRLEDGTVKDLEFEMIHFSPMPAYDQMFAIYSKELLKIGVRGKGLGLDWPTLIKRVEERNFDGVAMAWMLVYDTDPYQIWHSSQADNPKGSNRIGFKNDEVDAIIEAARQTFDPDKRSALFHRFHQIMHDEQPYTIWRARMAVFAWNERLGDIRFDTRRPQRNELEWWDHSRQ